jgi:4-alpha-glucanotransferase
MAPRISLALAFHNHQPVGNFGWVFDEVCETAYRPMIDALERHPGVRLSLHYSGPLLEWLRAERPELVARIVALVERGQVEILGGGWFEPILASLPERDRLAQLERMANEVETTFGRRPEGAWLAERVWEPDLPTSLVAAGYRWTILDDEHFRAASIPDDRLWGAYTTDDQGQMLTVFGTEERLRYLVPFGEVDDVIAHLRAHATEAGTRVGVMGDDGEKFGGWPTTFEHCWGERRWVDRFFDAVEANRAWLTTVTPSEWLDREPPVGRVYLPTSSYAEMGEWALPPGEGLEYAAVRQRDREAGRPEWRWLRGGFWRNFQVKYREINDLHKQMLRTSAKVAGMPAGRARDVATDELGRGQSNDCYWHGLFGGVYIPHMRAATHEHLIAAEDAADRALTGGRIARADGGRGPLRDLDLDGHLDALLATDGQVATVTLHEGAGIGSWDLRAARHALLDVLRRRPEGYHAVLLAESAAATARESDATADDGAGVTSIHEIAAEKEPGLATHLHYDAYERRSGLVHLLGPAVDPAEFASGTFDERLDRVDGPFQVVEAGPTRLVVRRDAGVRVADGTVGTLRLERTLTLGGGRLDPWLETETLATNVGGVTIEGRLAIEWNVTLLGGGANRDAWWELPNGRIPHDGTLDAESTDGIRQGNDRLGVTIETSVVPAADAWISPIETVSKSESGFERVYQGSCLLLSLPVSLRPDDATGIRLRHAVTIASDRAPRLAGGTPG